MAYWEKYIIEGKSDKKLTASQKRKEAERIMSELKKQKSKERSSKGDRSEYTNYLKQQLEFKKKKYEDQKKRQLEKIKEKGEDESKVQKQKAKESLKNVKLQRIASKDDDLSSHSKAIENLGSLAFGITKSAYHGAKSLQKKKEAKSATKNVLKTQPEKKEPGKPGRPKSSGKGTAPTGETSVAPERRRLVPSTKRLPSASKKIAPSGGTPYQAPPAPERQTGMRLGQRARRNPALKSALIKSRMEEYSNWKEEFLFEVEEKKKNKIEKEKIIGIMVGTNKIEMNPRIMEDHKEIASGKKKDDEGYMVNVELDQMERAIKALRKKVKKSDMQLPAWVQSKITRAAEYVDTASEYLQSDEDLSEEIDKKKNY